MDLFILNLGIRWLAAEDAFSASCVSQEWRQFLSADRDNGDLWKQICLNSGPSNIPNLTNSNDYRHLAMGLRLREVAPVPPPEQPIILNPTTCLEDYFAVVDVYKRHEEVNGKRRKELIASIVFPMEDMGKDAGVMKNHRGEMESILRVVNPYSANMKDSNEVRAWRQEVSSNNEFSDSSPVEYAARAASRKFYDSPRHQIDVKLFRRDSAKSVCLVHGAPLGKFDDRAEGVFAYTKLVDLAFARNVAGMIARGLIHEDSSSAFDVECCAIFGLKSVPPPGSDEAPQWLINSREAYQDQRAYEPSASDMDALSTIDHFEFVLEAVGTVGMHFDKESEWDINELKGQNELIIALEGLCWE